MMRILYICTYYHRAMVFRDSMNHLENRGHKITAFNAVARGTRIDEKYKSIMDDRVIHKECFNRGDRLLYFKKQKLIQTAIESSVNVASFDLVHSHTMFNGGWAAYNLQKTFNVPYVVTVRNTDLNVFLRIPFFRPIGRLILEHASGILFLSNAYRDRTLSTCFKHDEIVKMLDKTAVIPNGLERFWLDNKWKPRDAAHMPIRLLSVGKIDKNKNMKTTLKVLNQLNEIGASAQLTVIGQVVDRSIERLLSKESRVVVVPYLTKEELIQYYREADVFVMPSYNETFGRVYAEAMTQGLPVIYTREQGFDGLFERGSVGYSVKANDSNEITDAILHIMQNYQSISSECIRKCHVFDWNNIAERLEKLYVDAKLRGVS